MWRITEIKLPKKTLEKGYLLENEGKWDVIVIVKKSKGETFLINPISKGMLEAAKEEGLLAEWKTLKIKGRVKTKNNRYLIINGKEEIEDFVLYFDEIIDNPPNKIIEETLWRFLYIENNEVEEIKYSIKETQDNFIIEFIATVDLEESDIENSVKYSIESSKIRDIGWKK